MRLDVITAIWPIRSPNSQDADSALHSFYRLPYGHRYECFCEYFGEGTAEAWSRFKTECAFSLFERFPVFSAVTSTCTSCCLEKVPSNEWRLGSRGPQGGNTRAVLRVQSTMLVLVQGCHHTCLSQFSANLIGFFQSAPFFILLHFSFATFCILFVSLLIHGNRLIYPCVAIARNRSKWA